MPRRVLARDSSTTTQFGGPKSSSEHQLSDRVLRLRSPARGHSAGYVDPMPPQELREQPHEPRWQPGQPDRRSPAAATPQECRLGPESSTELEPAPSPVSEPQSSPEPERRRHGSPERLTRSASPEPAPRLARRAKRQRRLHEEHTPATPDTSDRRPVRSARRCLFGRPDHDDLERSLREEQRAISRAETLRWNFDFEREVPLAGRWQWESEAPRGATAQRPP